MEMLACITLVFLAQLQSTIEVLSQTKAQWKHKQFHLNRTGLSSPVNEKKYVDVRNNNETRLKYTFGSSTIKPNKTCFNMNLTLSFNHFLICKNNNRNLGSHKEFVKKITERKLKYVPDALNMPPKRNQILAKTLNRINETKTEQHATYRVRRDVSQCLETGSCLLNKDFELPVCYCDNACKTFSDCCHDNRASFTDSVESKIEYYFRLNYTSCITKIVPDYLYEKRGYTMVSTCPDHYDNTNVAEQCWKTISVTHIPVTGSDDVVYKNEYCARCHGMNQILKWTIRYGFDCSVNINSLININSSSDFVDLFQTQNCKLTFFPPVKTVRPRVCWNSNIHNEQIEDALNATLCQRYQNPISSVKSSNMLKRNIFCINNSTYVDKTSLLCYKPINESTLKLTMHQMTALFDLNIETRKSDRRCFGGQQEKEMCNFGIIEAPEITIKFRIFSNATDDKSFFIRLSKVVISMLKWNIPWKTKNQIFINFMCYYVDCRKYLNTSEMLGSADCLDINQTISIHIDDKLTLQEISDIYSNIRNVKWTYIEQYHKDGTLYNLSFSSIMIESAPIVIKEYQRFESTLSSKYFGIKLSNDSSFHQQISELNPSTTQLFSNLEITAAVKYYGRYFDSSNYSFKLVHIKNLSSQAETNGNTMYFDWNLLKMTLTYVFMGLSSALLLTAILIQIYFKQAINFARKMSINVMVCMLLSHILFMFGFGANDIYVVCFIIGVVSHYAWLCCFVWITLHMVSITDGMIKLRKSPNIPKTRNLSIHNYIIGYGIPLLIVAPSVLLDLFSYLKIGYGYDVCFPSVFPFNVIVFIAPVTLTVLISVLASIISGRLITLLQQDILKQSKSLQMRSYWIVYTRFFVFSGSSWLLGIVAELTHLNVLQMLFILLAGSHGFFFSICMLTSLKNHTSKKQYILQKPVEQLRTP